MTLSGTRGIVRVSKNLECDLQTAMVVEALREPDVYRMFTGDPFPGEYGERASARRRGSKFESNVMQNNAALLRRAVAQKFGYPDAEALVVRNFADETSGPMRLVRVRRVFGDIARGIEVPHILLQAHLRLPVGPELNDFGTIYPDVMVLDPERRMYLPGELKSFIVRGNVVDPPDLEISRRQVATQILALRAEADLAGLGDRVNNEALFVFSLPFGLVPATPVIEDLSGELREAELALERLRVVRARVRALKATDPGATLVQLAAELPANYRDSCIGSCILASWCERSYAGRARLLGDAIAVAVGMDTPIERIRALAAGDPPRTAEEALLAPQLMDASEALGRIA